MSCTAKLVLVGAAVAGVALIGCGSATSGDASSAAPTVSGVAMFDHSAPTSVALRDASDPSAVHTATPGADGSFTFHATGLAAPFILRAEGGEGALYTIVGRAGAADVNQLTSTVVAGAARGDDAGEAWTRWERDGEDGEHDIAENMGAVIRSLRTVLKPLFDLYQVGRIAGDDDEGDASGMRALLKDVSFTVSKGVVTVTNRATSGVIFSGPLTDLASGVFHPENMPAGPGGEPPPPTTCTSFTYGAWSPAVCPASGQQTRTVATSSPAGCTGGSPVLTQACTYVPPADGTALYGQKCAGCHGALASSNLKGKNMSVTSIKSAGMAQGLTDAQLQAVVTAVGP